MFRILARRLSSALEAGARCGAGNQISLMALAPLAIDTSPRSFDPTFLVCGMAVLSAGLVVLHASRTLGPGLAPVAKVQHPAKRLYTAEEALAERGRLAGQTDVLVDALATAAATFYAIAGQLPADASERALQRADDLRELVWMNRAGA
jgi:hypothetical protein